MSIKVLTELGSINEKEVAILITKIISKIYEPRSYNETVNDPVHGCCWRKIIKEELQNLKNYQIWKYKEFSIE